MTNTCECNEGCRENGWCLGDGCIRIERDGVEMLVCDRCTLTGDKRLDTDEDDDE